MSISYTSAIISNTIFQQNQAEQGGAIYADNAIVSIYNSTFVNNECSIQDIGGGAIYLWDSNLYAYNCTFIGNNNPLYEGKIRISNAFWRQKSCHSISAGSGSVLAMNYDLSSGMTNAYFSQCIFANNAANYGTIANTGPYNLTIEDSIFDNNNSTSGSVLCSQQSSSTNSFFTMNRVIVRNSNNLAIALYDNAPAVWLYNCTFSNNTGNYSIFL